MPQHDWRFDARALDEMQLTAARHAETAARATTGAIDGMLRYLVVVPAAAFALHLINPEIPWWPCCGIVAFSLFTMTAISGAAAVGRKFRSGFLAYRRRAKSVRL